MNYILKNENAIYYECKYSCDNVIYLSLGSQSYFITDARYTIEATALVQNAEVVTTSNLIKKTIKLIKKSNIKNIEFDSYEWNYNSIIELSENLKIDFIRHDNMSYKKRAIKRDEEIKYLSKAVSLGAIGFDRYAKYLNSKGLNTNEKRLQFDNKISMSNYGKYDISFEPIVAINQNASKPHSLPTKSRLQKDDLILVDAGIKYKRYCSDRTRTASFHEGFQFNLNQKFKSKRVQRAYDIVLKAHDKTIEKLRVGMSAKEVDSISRKIIDKSEFKDLFIHSTGHGVGLDIHEYPYISSINEMIIEDNMVFTVEPGIYLDNYFGIRVEDMIVMQNGKAKVL